MQKPKKNKKKKNVKLTEKLSNMLYHWLWKKSHNTSLTAGHYHIKNKIGEGTFGKVMLAMNIYTKVYVAAKLEPLDCPAAQLEKEFAVYEALAGAPGISEILYYGPCNERYNALVMELLGPDLEDLLEECKPHFSYKTVLMIAMQTLKLMQFVHERNIIYRDVKPENFCIGHQYQGTEKTIHLIDFGLSRFCDADSYRQDQKINYIVGTARYMSVNAHKGIVQGKKDDLESLGYMYVYLVKGRLPWMQLSDKGSAYKYYKTIGDLKEATKPESLCHEYPAFVSYMRNVNELNYNETPNYNLLQKIFADEMNAKHYRDDGDYDWTFVMAANYLKDAIEVDPDD